MGYASQHKTRHPPPNNISQTSDPPLRRQPFTPHGVFFLVLIEFYLLMLVKNRKNVALKENSGNVKGRLKSGEIVCFPLADMNLTKSLRDITARKKITLECN